MVSALQDHGRHHGQLTWLKDEPQDCVWVLLAGVWGKWVVQHRGGCASSRDTAQAKDSAMGRKQTAFEYFMHIFVSVDHIL